MLRHAYYKPRKEVFLSQLASAATDRETAQQEDLSGPPAANRHRLPDERAGITHHFSIAGHEGYLTVGLYPNGQPGEIFVRMAKEGSTIAGLMECFGTVVSVSLRQTLPYAVRAIGLDGE
jgi:ribonucleoside-diphosphate reductase alpha chain